MKRLTQRATTTGCVSCLSSELVCCLLQLIRQHGNSFTIPAESCGNVLGSKRSPPSKAASRAVTLSQSLGFFRGAAYGSCWDSPSSANCHALSQLADGRHAHDEANSPTVSKIEEGHILWAHRTYLHRRRTGGAGQLRRMRILRVSMSPRVKRKPGAI